jgi:twitching motility protein PilT
MKINETPILAAQLVHLLHISIAAHASDLHLSARHSPMIRVEGELMVLTEFAPFTADELKHILFSALDEQQQRWFCAHLDLDFAFVLPEMGRFRVNMFQQLHGIAAVFRIVPLAVPTLDGLNAPAVVKRLLDLPAGLVLVTGATGCGKSTTLAAMVEHINNRHRHHVLTVEDPIEFVYTSKTSLVHQRQVHRDTLSFDAALRSALREDPDVILIGELRDLETIRLALSAAETGHLVLATLHTASAPGAISRMIDVFPISEKNIIRNLIAGSLQAVICQHLVKQVTGGRTAAFEIMLGTQAIRHLIREDKIAQLYSVMQTSTAFGMCTMEQSLAELVNKNIAAKQELVKNVSDALRL